MVKRLSSVNQNSNPITNVPTPSAGTDAANKSYVDAAVAAVGGGSGATTYLNTIYSAQKNLTSSGLPTLTGSVNGSNAAFTVPEAVYAAGTLRVFLNGVLQPLGDAITETTPASGIFTFVTAPTTGDQIMVTYQKQSTQAGTLVGSVVAGTNVTVDNTDPLNPIISAAGGTPTELVGPSTKVSADVDALHGPNNVYMGSTVGYPGVQLVTPQDFSIWTNTGTDGAGAWDTDFIMGLNNMGQKGFSLESSVVGSMVNMSVPEGVRITKVPSGANSAAAILKVDNVTAEQTLQFPDGSGTIATQEYVSANAGGGTVTGDKVIIDASDVHSPDGNVLISPVGGASYVSINAPQEIDINANTGTDGSGAWDAFLNLSSGGAILANTGTAKTTALVGDGGVEIRKAIGNTSNAFLKVDNLTAARAFQFPDTAGTLATQAYADAAKTTLASTGTSGQLKITASPDGGDYNIFHEQGTAKTLAIYGSAAGTMNVSILDGALDIGGVPVPTTSSTSTLTNKRITSRVGTVASSATPTINTDNVDQFNITALAAAITSMTTNLSGTPTDGQKLMIRIKDNGTARAITWGASFVSSGVATLLATTVASKTHMVGFVYDSAAAKWVCVAVDAAGY